MLCLCTIGFHSSVYVYWEFSHFANFMILASCEICSVLHPDNWSAVVDIYVACMTIYIYCLTAVWPSIKWSGLFLSHLMAFKRYNQSPTYVYFIYVYSMYQKTFPKSLFRSVSVVNLLFVCLTIIVYDVYMYISQSMHAQH